VPEMALRPALTPAGASQLLRPVADAGFYADWLTSLGSSPPSSRLEVILSL
jgi:hypothetical protein